MFLEESVEEVGSDAVATEEVVTESEPVAEATEEVAV